MPAYLLMFVLVLCTFNAQAQPHKTEIINQLIAQSGLPLLSVQAEQIVDLFSFTQLLDAKQKAQAKAQIDAMFAYDVLFKSATKALETQSYKQLKLWQNALSSKPLMQLYQLEKTAINAQFSSNYNEYMLALKAQPLRVLRITKLVELINHTQRYTWLWVVRKSSFDALSNEYGKPAVTLSAKRLKKRFVHFYLYACRHLSDKEIDEIITAYKKEEVQKWLAVMTASLKKSL